MNLNFAALLGRKRLVLTIALLFFLAGLAAWFGMNRQEDPSFPYRFGFVLVEYPGADVEQVRRLVAEPLEEELSAVEELLEIRSTIRAGFVHTILRMHEHVYDTDTAWDRVRAVVARAEQRFPDGVGPPLVDDRQIDAATAVYAVTGSADRVALQAAAERLRKQLYALDEVARIRIYGDSEEQLTIEVDPARLSALALTPADIAAQLEGRNAVVPGGFLTVDARQALIRPVSDFDNVASVRQTPIRLPDGSQLPLAQLADIRLQARDPLSETVWVDGMPAVAVAVVAINDRINAEDFGQRLQARVDQLRDSFAPLQIERMFFQPERVSVRLRELGFSLLMGVVIVATLLLLTMGPRLGFTVAAIVPLVAMSSLAVFNLGGGVLHQMAVAGMVIALGMLVDNAIVMVENIQWHLDRGASRGEAAVVSVRELAGPLAAATGTTLAVFVPMLISRGNTADFTRAIPLMIILMLTVSYLFALLVTPLLAERFLRGRSGPGRGARVRRWGRRLGRFAVERGGWVAVFTLLMVAASVFMSQFVSRDFFPTTDRNQLVIDVYFDDGTPIEVTTEFVLDLSAAVRGQPGVTANYAFSGNSGPRFYYNLIETPGAPHVGRVVLEAARVADLPQLMDWVRDYARDRPEAQVVVKRLAQGPPTQAPVEYRVVGEDYQQVARVAEDLSHLLRRVPGTVDIRHSLGIGIPSIQVTIDDAEAARAGLSRVDVARALALQTQGLRVGTYRAEEDPVPIVLRYPQSSGDGLDRLRSAQIPRSGDNDLPLAQTTVQTLEWQPAVIHHYGLRPTVSVYSELQPGYTYNDIYAAAEPLLQDMDIGPGVEILPSGFAESSGEANSALFHTLPVGLAMLLFFLLLQFNSFRRVAIILVTVPLAVTGVVPGLLLTGYSFGFTALLGLIALIGIVVNNAIVLLDVVDSHLKAGESPKQAVIEAVSRRARPILLTTATTVAGLMPLTLSSATLWPPMAWTIISGLLASTVLTLVVVPSLSARLLR